MSTLYYKLSDNFDQHSGQLTDYVDAELDERLQDRKHYNLRAFHTTQLTVPWSELDAEFWQNFRYPGLNINDPRTIVNATLRRRTMEDIESVPMTMLDLDALNMSQLTFIQIQRGNEEWTATQGGGSSFAYGGGDYGDNLYGTGSVTGTITIGKDSAFRWANTLRLTLIGGSPVIFTSFYKDDIITDFQDQNYYLELALPGFPAQAAADHLDLANSYIELSSSESFDPAETDALYFSNSLNDITAGGNTYARWSRDSLVNANLASIRAIRLVLQSVGSFQMVLAALRLIPENTSAEEIEIDTKRGILARAVPRAGAPEPSTVYGDIYFERTRPKDGTFLVKFNTGHHPTGTDNKLRFYLRTRDGGTSKVEVQLVSRDTQSRLRLYNWVSGVVSEIFSTPILTNILVAETDYYLQIELEGTQIKATVYNANGLSLGTQVYTTGWQTIPYDPDREGSATLTTTGNEITDAVRTTNIQGDGRTPPDSSFGIWEATTNHVKNGGFETNTSFWEINTTGAAISRVAATGKFGSAHGRVTGDGSAANQGMRVPNVDRPAAASGQTWTASVWLRGAVGGESIQINVVEYDNAGSSLASSTSIVTLTQGWQRATVTRTFTDAGTTKAGMVISSNGTFSYTADVDGIQLENQPLATPYVHTDGATATRAAARVQAPASLLDETQGWVAMRVRLGWANTFPETVSVFTWGTGGARLICYWDSTNDRWVMLRENGGQGYAIRAHSFSADSVITIVCKWTATGQSISINGEPFLTNNGSAVIAIPDVTSTIDIGSTGASSQIDSDVLWLACGIGTLTDANAATIHGFGNLDPAWYELPDNSDVTATWDADTTTYFFPMAPEPERGLVGYSFEPYNYDFTLDFVGPLASEFGQFETTSFGSLLPVVGASLWSYSSPPINVLSNTTKEAWGDATISETASYSEVTRTGIQFQGGTRYTNRFFVGDTEQLYITGEIYPVGVVRGTYRVALVDPHDTVVYIGNIDGLRKNEWNEFSLYVGRGIFPTSYYLHLQQQGYFADTFRFKNVKMEHNTLAWYASANNGTNWQPFLNAYNKQWSAVKFSTIGKQLKVKAEAHSDAAWIQGYELIPRYLSPGRSTP